MAIVGLSTAAQAADTTIVVTPNNPHGFSSAETANGGVTVLTDDPPKPGEFGPGYLAMSTPPDTNSAKAAYFSSSPDVAGRPLADLTGASYQAYRDSASTGLSGNRPSLQLPLYQNVAPGSSGANYTRLTFEPLYCYNDLVDDVWQTLGGDHQEPGTLGCWHYNNAPDTYYKTLADAKAAFPQAVLLGYGFNLGSYQPGIISRVDDLELEFTDGTLTFDFEASDPVPPPPPLKATIDSVSKAEGNSGTSGFAFKVTLNRASDTATVIHYATNDGTASVADSDYVAKTGDLTIPAGETSATITVSVRGDTKVESDEVFHVRITSTDADVSSADYASGNIVNDDSTPPPPSKPSISIRDANTPEGNSGTHPIKFTVVLSKKSTVKVTVRYTTADGAAKAGSDYVAKSGTVTFSPGDTSETVTVQVKGDRAKEQSEGFFVALTNPTNATIADANASGVITNDDR